LYHGSSISEAAKVRLADHPAAPVKLYAKRAKGHQARSCIRKASINFQQRTLYVLKRNNAVLQNFSPTF
jgi:hypothetical protein